jgi:hypothetical protein
MSGRDLFFEKVIERLPRLLSPFLGGAADPNFPERKIIAEIRFPFFSYELGRGLAALLGRRPVIKLAVKTAAKVCMAVRAFISPSDGEADRDLSCACVAVLYTHTLWTVAPQRLMRYR